MRVDIFDFDLPENRIALTPTARRDDARLLYIGDAICDRVIRDLPSLLRPGDLLVMNDTRVIPAQLKGMRKAREAGGHHDNIEIDVTLHQDLGVNSWRAFARPAKRMRAGDRLTFSDRLTATVTERDGAEVTLAFETDAATFEEALAQAGAMPLPPYIARKRAISEEDKERYQTVYARDGGSVAAPTAGLHFTDELLSHLQENGVAREMITLHVGAGTFLPVSADDTSEHKMHSEWGKITERQATAINEARRKGGRIVAVGTTSLRLLESAAGADGLVHPFARETDIFITPGYKFKVVDLLMTNFHLPRSTLFMLVCAFAGTGKMKAAYAHAIENEYRFYSYGDACLLEREK